MLDNLQKQAEQHQTRNMMKLTTKFSPELPALKVVSADERCESNGVRYFTCADLKDEKLRP